MHVCQLVAIEATQVIRADKSIWLCDLRDRLAAGDRKYQAVDEKLLKEVLKQAGVPIRQIQRNQDGVYRTRLGIRTKELMKVAA